jgi:hypothetical protein
MLVNSIIANSPRDQALLASISANNGPTTQPTFTEKVLPAGTVAQADYFTHTIFIDSSQLQAAINSNQDIGAIIEHELLHLWMETGDVQSGAQPHPFPSLGVDNQVTVTLDDGTILTFDQTAVRAADRHIDLSVGYSGYEHILIHQILLNENPDVGDQTGAMKSAFLQASSVTLPGQAPQKISDDATAGALGEAHKKSKTNVKPPTPPATGTYSKCSTAKATMSLARQSKADRRTHEVVVYNGETYYVPWDGAIY